MTNNELNRSFTLTETENYTEKVTVDVSGEQVGDPFLTKTVNSEYH